MKYHTIVIFTVYPDDNEGGGVTRLIHMKTSRTAAYAAVAFPVISIAPTANRSVKSTVAIVVTIRLTLILWFLVVIRVGTMSEIPPKRAMNKSEVKTFSLHFQSTQIVMILP